MFLEPGQGSFLAKILKGFKLLTIFEKKAPSQMFDRLKIGVWVRVSNIELTFVPGL